jgi:DNA polymerase-3 subunit delta'
MSIKEPFLTAAPKLIGLEKRYVEFEQLAAGSDLPGSWLFWGEEGIGKRSFAEAWFGRIENGTWGKEAKVDILRLAPDPEEGYGIEVARTLQKFLWQTPLKSPRRLAILDQADELTDQAQNAMLKILEEPPKHSLIVLIATEPELLLPTLRSRMIGIHFPRLNQKEMEEFLVERKIASEKHKTLIANSFGRPGYALRLMVGSGEGDSLANRAASAALKARNEGKLKLAKALLNKEVALRRSPLNANLQERAIKEFFN